MPIAPVKKIYENEKDIKEFNSFTKQMSKEKDAIHLIFENASPFLTDFVSISEKLKVLDDVSGMLNELTPEQMKIFETSVKRRHLFK